MEINERNSFIAIIVDTNGKINLQYPSQILGEMYFYEETNKNNYIYIDFISVSYDDF